MMLFMTVLGVFFGVTNHGGGYGGDNGGDHDLVMVVVMVIMVMVMSTERSFFYCL